MGGELNHSQVADLLGAYALDAVEQPEREVVEDHLRECRVCRDEVAEHRDTAGFLAPGFTRAPEGLWDRIAGSLEESPPPLELSPVVPLAEVRAAKGAPSRGTQGSRRTRAPAWIGMAAAAAAIVIIAGFGIFRVLDDGGVGSGGGPDVGLEQAMSAARADPAAREVELRADGGKVAAEAVVLPDGSGYLEADLAAVGPDRTYQLWALVGSSKISVGVLGQEPHRAAFRAAGDVWGLAITEEAAGGVVITDQQPVGVGTLS